MCGIFGHIGHIDREQAERAISLLAHRGPDGQGVVRLDGATLGHRRLAILDLSDRGAQPLSTPDKRFWITYNGELYNFVEIRKTLSELGHAFVSESDTEVVLAAYQEWGPACLERFNGMWALAIWDDQDKTLFLARDRFGKKPLFFTRGATGLSFASEMKALLPLIHDPQINREIVGDTTQLVGYEAGSQCLVQQIERLRAGHWAMLRDGRLEVRRWWNTLDHLPEIPQTYQEQTELFREIFLDACALRMRSDVPLGTALSGGLDSSSVLAAVHTVAQQTAIKRTSSSWQHAFVAAFPGTPFDEQKYAEAVAGHLGIQAHPIEIDPRDAAAGMARHIYLFEEIYPTAPSPFILLYSRMRQNGVYVSLDGHGADECYAGYGYDFLNALADARLSPGRIRDVLDVYYNAYGDNPVRPPLPGRTAFWLGWWKQRMRRPTPTSRDAGHPRWKSLGALNRALYASTHETMLPSLLRNYDRYAMASGVEVRMPFMDHRLVCLAFALPWSAKLRNGCSKAIVRDAMAPYLPREIAYRKDKIGFNTPIVQWIQGPLREYFLDMVHEPLFGQCDLIDPAATRQAVEGVINNPGAGFAEGRAAWAMLMPYLWERYFFRGEGAQA